MALPAFIGKMFGTKEYAGGGVVGDRGSWWWPIISEPYTGAWQRNDERYMSTSVLSNTAVFRCVTLIASSLAKMRLRIVQQDSDGIWSEVEISAFTPVLRNPNDYENRIQFIEQWLLSKLLWGNTYVLKERDNRNVIRKLYILDPRYTRPAVSPDGSVIYQIRRDDLNGVYESADVPASEIIHDRMNAFFHPLCGLSPIYCAGLSAMQALRIQTHSERFFANGASPGGMLTAPAKISDDNAKRLKETFSQSFGGRNMGKLFVAGDGIEYKSLSMPAVDAQMIEQLKWTGQDICSAFGVPSYKLGYGPAPSYNNIEALERQFYADCLQILIESIELCLDEGLELPKPYGTEFDLDDLLRMDTSTMIDSMGSAVRAGLLKPNEGRKKLNYGPVTGGGSPYLQQQNFSLEALAKRDAKEDPFSKTPAQPPSANPQQPPPQDDTTTTTTPDETNMMPDGGRLLRNALAAHYLTRIKARASDHRS